MVRRDLVPAFVKLLKDSEAEVRTAIAGQIPGQPTPRVTPALKGNLLTFFVAALPGFCGLLDRQTLLDEIMGAVEDLVSDSSQHVRAALGTQISGLAPILGKEESVWGDVQVLPAPYG